MHLCRKCGGALIFRRFVRHWKTGRIFYPRHGKAFPIHLSGACGQLTLAL